jgi:hypothetical protein
LSRRRKGRVKAEDKTGNNGSSKRETVERRDFRRKVDDKHTNMETDEKTVTQTVNGYHYKQIRTGRTTKKHPSKRR